MKQVLIKDGSVRITEVPSPQVSSRNVLVRVTHSCISAGTEIASVRMSGMPLYKRALAQPENVRRVLSMVREQGLAHTIDRVRGRLSAGSPTGYSAAGVVVAIGKEVVGFAVGDRVACAGAGIANHAEFIDVPVNLAVPVPEGVDNDAACTVTLGAIALQGLRRAAPTLGETFVVSGLGLLGQLLLQMLAANGCHVIGIDPDARRRALALQCGAAAALDPFAGNHLQQVLSLTDGAGADGTIITAAGSSDEIVSDAFKCCRRKGRVVLVGDVGLGLRRADFYAKEIDFLISASYGPGRYDPYYEEEGQDYPLGYVRWTENRNMEAYLGLLAARRVQLEPLGPRLFELGDAASAYASLQDGPDRAMLAILVYPQNVTTPSTIVYLDRRVRAVPGRIKVGIIGAGGFAQAVHLPNLQRLRDRYEIRAIATRTGANARAIAQQFSAAYATTNHEQLLSDSEIDLVLIATRHDLHAPLALAALAHGKHVLVEKPLALSEEDLLAIEQFFARDPMPSNVLMTGFNRRFSPAIAAALRRLDGRSGPLIVSYRMNAGHIPGDHWVHGPQGGGRNIGEACHIYDVFAALTGSEAIDVQVQSIDSETGHLMRGDNFIATARYRDGSVCSLVYTAMGDRSYPKERMEIFCDGIVIALDDYRSLSIVPRPDGEWHDSAPQKGQLEELVALADALRDGRWPISLESQLATTRLSFTVERLIRERATVHTP